jgi:NADP-dependent 3-hydroxy acid dehydrogenase YdfG
VAHSPLERRKIDDRDRMIDVNLKGVLYGIAAALPYMQRQKSGHFINVASVAGHKVRPGGVVNAASKHAVRALSEGLRSSKYGHQKKRLTAVRQRSGRVFHRRRPH